jgi:hypothetical protein
MAQVNEEFDTSPGTGIEADEPSLRDTLDAAFEDTPTDEVRVETDSAAAQRARDELGRFAPEKAPGGPQETRAPVTRIQGSPQGAAAPQGPADAKAPASWTPAEREHWNTLKPEVRAAIARREGEMGRVLQEGAAHRQAVEAVQGMLQPYEMFFRQEGVAPLQAVDHVMRQAAELRLGTPGAKAALIANLIDTHAIDINMLDTLLAHKVPIQQMQQMNAQQAQAYRDPRVDQLLAQQQHQASQAEAFESQQIRGALTGFAQSHEFYPDVAGIMADIVEMRANRNEPIDMERIYAQACTLHEGVSQVMSQRRPGPSNRQAVLRARRAAVSVAGESTPHGGATMPESDDIRSLLAAAMDQQTR